MKHHISFLIQIPNVFILSRYRINPLESHSFKHYDLLCTLLHLGPIFYLFVLNVLNDFWLPRCSQYIFYVSNIFRNPEIINWSTNFWIPISGPSLSFQLMDGSTFVDPFLASRIFITAILSQKLPSQCSCPDDFL